MRIKFNQQQELDFTPSTLKVTNNFYRKYERISAVLDKNPKIVNAIHKDLSVVFAKEKEESKILDCDFTTETVFRILIVKHIEGLDYRGLVVRIDDSDFFRRFARIYNGKMMDYTTVCKMYKAIRPKTWEKANKLLKRYAIEAGKITGEQLRRDTTVYEANIHYPTDSYLLWDTYRVLTRLIDRVRDVNPELVGDRRLRRNDVKRLYQKINRQAARSVQAQKALKGLYKHLIEHVEKILVWAKAVTEAVEKTCTDYTFEGDTYLQRLVKEYQGYIPLGYRVVDQARRRVVHGESVPNEEKIFSIFEPHVELIKKGKAGKPVEFGHLINLQQVEEKFITDYEVFEKRPVEHALVDSTIKRHVKDFGDYPEMYADDKGAYESMEKLYDLEEKIDVVGICKKGRRNDREEERENDPAFKLAQKFRAGIEGSISFLKRVLGLAKCMYKSFQTFKASVGNIIFCHNLIILSRL